MALKHRASEPQAGALRPESATRSRTTGTVTVTLLKFVTGIDDHEHHVEVPSWTRSQVGVMSFLSQAVFTSSSIMMMMYFAGSWFGSLRDHHVLPVSESAPVFPGHPVIDWTRRTQVVSLSHPAAGLGFAAAQLPHWQPAVIGSSAIGKTTGRT
jgi:hypothetical protein